MNVEIITDSFFLKDYFFNFIFVFKVVLSDNSSAWCFKDFYKGLDVLFYLVFGLFLWRCCFFGFSGFVVYG